MAWYLINEIPGVKALRYLELGTQTNYTFSRIECLDKTSVDILHPADFQMSTDEFFRTIPKDKLYDIIFIDACHVYDFVVRDYINSVEHLSPGGIIFIHDLFPPDENHTSPSLCGDGYKFLSFLVESVVPVFVLGFDFGLSMILRPPVLYPPPQFEFYSYEHFRKLIAPWKRYTKAEMVHIIQQIQIKKGGEFKCQMKK